MRSGVKRMLALLLVVVFTAGISGVGALMEITSVYEGTVVTTDSGETSPEPPEPESSAPSVSSEPELPVSSVSSEQELPVEEELEAQVLSAVPPANMTQEQVNQYVNALLARLYSYQADPAGNAENIWQAARELIALPRDKAERAPDFNRTLTLLDTLSALTGKTQTSVQVSDRVKALGILPETVSVTGLATLSGISGGVPVTLFLDGRDAPTNRLPSDVTGRNMVVLDIGFVVGGVTAQLPLPVQINVPLPHGAQRSRAVLMCYENGATSPRRVTPSLYFESPIWRMSFAAEGRGEFVLANLFSQSSSSNDRNFEEERIYGYWLDVIGRIEAEDPGGEVYASPKSAGARNVPITVLDALYGRDVTLYIDFGASNDIIIYGATMGRIPSGKVFYPYWDLYDLYHNADGTPVGGTVSRIPVEGDPAEILGVPKQYVDQIVPVTGGVQSTYAPPAGGGVQSAPASAPVQQDATMAQPEELASRAEGSAEKKPTVQPTAVQTAAQQGGIPGTITIPIWAPALVAAGVLVGLIIGVLAAGARRTPRAHEEDGGTGR